MIRRNSTVLRPTSAREYHVVEIVLPLAGRTRPGRRKDTRQAQDPGLEVPRGQSSVDSGGERLEGRIQQPEEMILGLVLLGELQHVVRQVGAQEDSVQIGLEIGGRSQDVHGRDPDELPPVPLHPIHPDLPQD